ncbi:hypothetical protein MSG28_007447, partial [Choristoneura fumiferana]
NIWRPRRKVLAPVFSIKNLQGFVSEFARQATIMTKLLEQEIVRLKREELATLKSNNEPVENKTFLDMIIDSSSKIKGYSDVEVREEVIVIMSAGSDTSAVGTGYTAVMLSRYPEVQEKVYQELEEVFGNNSRPVTAADLPKLVYLEAVVKETLRLYPPVPIYVRETHSDCKLPNGLTVPKGVALLFLLHGMHRNPKYWGDDAEQFRPERFFEGSLRHPVQFIPFSYSVRNCLETGIKYRRLQNKLKEMLVSKPRSKESYLSKETLELLDERRTLISNKGDKERRQKIANLSKEIKENMRRDRKEKIHRVLEENIKRTGGTKKAMKQLSKHGKEWISKQKQSESYLTNRLSIQKLATEYYRLLYSDKFDLGLATIPEERENLMNLFKKAARIANDQGGLSSFWLGPKLYIESALGVKMNSQQNSDHRFMKAFEKVSHLVARRIVTVWMHPDVIYKNLPIYKEFKESRRVLFDFVDKLIQNKREELKNNNNQLYDQNWMNLFKKAARIANNQGGLSSFWMGPKLYIVVTDPETVDVVLKSCMDKDDTTMRYCRTLTGNGSIFAAGGRRTFLEMMIMGSGGERGYTDLELREEVLVIILAGTDTSAVGASYASVLLSRFPNVQEKVYEELQDVFGDSDRPLTVQDLPNLKYLDAVMKETLRMYPPVPVTVREVHNDVVLPSGVTLVDGVSIFNNIWGIHRNPKYWGADADVFRPERFLDGYNYAMMSMKTVIANLVRAYKVLPPKDMNPAQLKEPLRLTKYVFYRIDSIPIWRPRRKILAPTFSMKNLNQFVEIFAQQSNLMTELLRPVAGKGDFSIWKYMNTYSFDSVCESALGVQMNSQQNSDHRFMKAFEKVSHLIARRIVSIWMHPDVIYKSLPIYKVFKENRRVLSFKLSVKN